MDDCLFCRIVAGKIPATVVYEDDDVMAINDVFPRAPFHVLVVPRKHVERLSDLEAGQNVLHLHLHVLGGREFAWPPG